MVLTDEAKGFASALAIMKANHWPDVRHLYCRWHVYEAIKRHCAEYFKTCEKGKRRAELNRFIKAFKDVVCAPNEIRMKMLWTSIFDASSNAFPPEAVQYIKSRYYESPRARQIMECYVFDCGNLHQTTTSRNEGSHAAFRSKCSIIPKLAESYLLRRKHKIQWMLRLRATAANARNRIPLDLQNTPELRDLVGKLSLFSLTEIKRQIILTKRESSAPGRQIQEREHCDCHTFHRYGLPCVHMVPVDGTAIPLDTIAPFWRLDNWEQG